MVEHHSDTTDIISGMDEGIRQAQKALVILSPAFFSKSWTMAELRALMARQAWKDPD